MMLEHLNENDSAARLLDAVKKVVSNDLKSMDAGRMGYGTKEVGDLVVKYLKAE
jgi:3-isopropylmalate dehydrogenase